MSKSLGDRAVGSTIWFDFPTHKADGTPVTLLGTPAISVYKNSTTESTTGVILTVDYDSRTGMNHVVIDTSQDGTFYATGQDFSAVITAGTVDSISVVGTPVACFSLGKGNVNSITSTAQTARDIGASVLLSAGTGAGQLDFTSGVVKANMVQILAAAITGTAANIVAAFTKFFDKTSPTGTINSLPDAVAGANGGLTTTNGTKQIQTVDLTAGQTIAATVADKAGYSLAATGLDLVTAASTFGTALIAGIWAAATSGLTAAGSIGKKLADWVVGKLLSYDTGLDPATQILVTPANKLNTDASNAAKIQKMAVTLAAGDVTGNVTADVQTIKTQAVTCAAPVTVNIKVGTTADIGFTGANVNAESKVTAAPTGMSTLAAGAKMDIVDVPNDTALAAVKTKIETTTVLSKTATAQTITPADTTAAATAQGTITKLEGLIQNSSGNRFTAKALEAAPTGGGGTPLTAQETANALLLAPAGTPATGSVMNLLLLMPANVWAWTGRTLTSFGSLVADTTAAVWAACTTPFAALLAAIRAGITADHGSGAYGAGGAGVHTISIITELADHTRVGNVHVAVYNDNGDFVKDCTTSSNGTATITLDDGTFTFPGFLMLYNIAIVSQAISANATVTITCVPAAEPAPTAGVQTMRFSARAMGASVLDTSAVITATFTTPNEDVNGATISSASAAVLNTGTQTWDLPLTIGATARIVGDGANGRFYQKDITVTSAAVSVPSDYD